MQAITNVIGAMQFPPNRLAVNLSELPPSSSLPQAQPTCPKCGDKGFLRQDLPLNHPQFGKPIKCDGVAHQPEQMARLNKISRLSEAELKIRLASIKPYSAEIKNHCPACKQELAPYQIEGYKGQTCKNCGTTFFTSPEVNRGAATNRPMLKAASEIINGKGKGFHWFWGRCGNAKSVIGKAVVNECKLAGIGPAMYASFSDILEYIKETWDEDNKAKESVRLRELVECPIVVIDELDKVNESNWLYTFRSRFLDKRYNNALYGDKYTATVVISNLHPIQFDDEALLDRFKHGGDRIVANTAPGARATQKWEQQ